MNRCLKQCKFCKRYIDVNSTGGEYSPEEGVLEVYCPVCEQLFEVEDPKATKCKICGELLFTDHFQKVEMCISCKFKRDREIYGLN